MHRKFRLPLLSKLIIGCKVTHFLQLNQTIFQKSSPKRETLRMIRVEGWWNHADRVYDFFSNMKSGVRVSITLSLALCDKKTKAGHTCQLYLSEGNQAARSNCSSSHRCHRSAHRGSTWFLLSRCKDRHFSLIFQTKWSFFADFLLRRTLFHFIFVLLYPSIA